MMTTAIQQPGSKETQPTTARRHWTFVPVVDIVERADEWLVYADLPGAMADNIDINFERGVLTLHADVQSRQDEGQTHFVLREYGVGDYHRSFEIGEGVDADRIHAEFDRGVLTLHLPKTEFAKPRKIQIRTR